MKFLQGDLQESAGHLSAGLSILRAQNDDRWSAVALRWKAQVHIANSANRDAVQCLYESIGAARRAGEVAIAAECKMFIARVHRKLSQLDEATNLCREAFEEISQLNGLTVLSHVAIDLSVLTRLRGALHDSMTYATRALAIGEETRHEVCRISALISLSRTESLLSGRFSESDATALLGSARSINAVHQVALILEDFGDHLFLLGRHSDALAKYEESLAEIEKVAPRGELVGELSWRIGLCHVRLGDLERAHTWITRGLDHCTKSGDLKELALTLRAQGHLFFAQGNIDLGFAKLDDALDRLTHLGVAFEAARTRLDLAKASRDFRRDRAAFDTHLDAARASFRTMGSNVGLDWIDSARAEAWPEVDDSAGAKRPTIDESLLDLSVSLPDAGASPPMPTESSLSAISRSRFHGSHRAFFKRSTAWSASHRAPSRSSSWARAVQGKRRSPKSHTAMDRAPTVPSSY